MKTVFTVEIGNCSFHIEKTKKTSALKIHSQMFKQIFWPI